MLNFSPCPKSVNWADDSLDRDLYIQGTTVTVLAMDGRRRWLDIRKLVSLAEIIFFLDQFMPLKH